MKSLTVAVSPAPRSANRKRGRAWYADKRERDRVGKEVWAQAAQAGNPKLRTPVKLSAVRRSWNRMDGGGLMESIKCALDALVSCGVIPDDSEKHVPLPWYGEQEIVRDRRRPSFSELVVTLEEID